MVTQQKRETLTAIFVELEDPLDKLFVLDPESKNHISLREASKRTEHQNDGLEIPELTTSESEIEIVNNDKGERTAFANASSNTHLCRLFPGIYIRLPSHIPCP